MPDSTLRLRTRLRAFRSDLALFACVALAAAVLHVSPLRERLDALALDATQGAMRALSPRPSPDAVALVGIDAQTEGRFPQPFALWHRPIASALSAIAQANPRLIVLDIVLPERAFEELLPGAHVELVRALAQAKRAAPLVAGLRLDAAGRPQPLDPLLMATLGEAGLGLAYAPMDYDGMARRTRPVAARSALLPLLSERIAALLGTQLPAGIIDFASGERFGYLPLHELIDRSAQSDPALAALLHDKVVLVGHVGPDEDRVAQPVSLAAWDPDTSAPPGVVLLAQTTRAALAGRILPQLGGVPLALLAAAAACIVFVRRPRWTWVIAVCAAGLLPVGVVFAYASGVYVPAATPLFVLIGGAAARTGREALEHWRFRRTVEQRFAGYVSQNLFQAIVAGEIDPSTPRRYRNLGFLFADLRGFTSMVEQLPPEQALGLLNRYYAAITPAIHRFDGTIDNFRGDGILAIFGAPRPAADGPRNALLAAHAMFDGLDALNGQLQREGQPVLRMGVGIAAGDCVAGNVGTSSRFGYSAVGDAVNIAARLQAHCKRLGMRIIASEAVAVAAAHAGVPAFQPLGELELSGHAPVLAFGLPQERESVTTQVPTTHVGGSATRA
jgi:adenylate cyclase